MNKQKSTPSLINSRYQSPTNPIKSLHSSTSHVQSPILLTPSLQPPQSILHTLQNFIPTDQCPYHSLQIQFCCFNCKQMCCCSKCLITGKHQKHDVKNIHRSYCMVETLLNEFTVKLTAKAEIYSLWYEKISISKLELIQDFIELKKNVNLYFQELKEVLEKKNMEIINEIESMKMEKQEYLTDFLNKLKNKVKLNYDSQNIVTNNIQELSQPALCKYYSEMKECLQGLVQENIESQLKSLTFRNKYIINLNKFKNIKQNLQNLTNLYAIETPLNKKVKYRANFNANPISSMTPLNDQTDINSQSMRINRGKNFHDIYHSPGVQSPINRNKVGQDYNKDYDSVCYSKNKQLVAGLISKNESKKNLKLFSATSSPFKEKKQSPLHYLEIQKKCFIKGKNYD